MSLDEKKESIRSTLESKRTELLRFVDNVTNDQLTLKMNPNVPDAWTILEVIKHLHLAEMGTIDLMEDIKNGGSGVSDDFDLKRYNMSRVKNLEEKNIPNLVNLLTQSRNRLLTFLEQLQEEDFSKKGNIVPKVSLSIEQLFGVVSNHEDYHLNKCKSSISSNEK